MGVIEVPIDSSTSYTIKQQHHTSTPCFTSYNITLPIVVISHFRFLRRELIKIGFDREPETGIEDTIKRLMDKVNDGAGVR